MHKAKISLLALFVMAFIKPENGSAIFMPAAGIVSYNTEYVCMPCGQDCDNTEYDKPGTCSHCNMELVLKKSITNGSVKPSDLCDFISKKGAANVILLDVRTPEEFNGKAEENYGRLKNAINIPIQELNTRMAELDKYKGQEIVVYCSHSHRSPRASFMLTQYGFKKVSNMLYGMSVWKEQVTSKECNKQLYVKQ